MSAAAKISDRQSYSKEDIRDIQAAAFKAGKEDGLRDLVVANQLAYENGYGTRRRHERGIARKMHLRGRMIGWAQAYWPSVIFFGLLFGFFILTSLFPTMVFKMQ